MWILQNVLRIPPMTYQEFYCTICKKQLSGESEYEAHLKSEEHAIAEVYLLGVGSFA